MYVSKLKIFPWNTPNSDYQDSDAWLKINYSSTKSSATIFKSWIETSMDEIKPIVTEKRQFEGRQESKFVAFSDILDRQDSDSKAKSDRSF